VLFTLLTQCLVVITINHCILSAQELSTLKALLPWVNLIVVAILILTMLSIKSLEEEVQNQTKIKLLSKHIEEIESLNLLLLAQKHEYSRHLQYLQSLAYLDKKDELIEYINAVAKDYRHTETLVNTGHPAITSLINTKKRTAEAQGIDFALAIKSDFSQLNISPWDLNSLLGNLIENAMEAAIYDKHPRVTIELSHQNGQYVIYIANNASTIIDKEKIFEPGYTTKGSLSRGYGLFLVKQLVEQYSGTITVISNRKTHVTVQIPDGEGGLGDDKFYLPEDCRSFG
jgi:sensor histidine kinase regulating citrate/malate metabolism